ncbi:hypothetical protein HDU96_009897 [Phlyctochytrium bullatum]|nr:hypothetical protein HDU96_009897 [Phlyctochytrium bullatum]
MADQVVAKEAAAAVAATDATPQQPQSSSVSSSVHDDAPVSASTTAPLAAAAPQPNAASSSATALQATTTTTTTTVIERVPDGQINLRLLLVSGKKSDFLVSPSDSVDAIKQKIFSNWPKEWTDEVPEGPNNIRLLHRGKFLEGNATLDVNTIPVGQTTTVHLLVKNGVQEAPAADKPVPVKEGASCRCNIL